MYVIAPEITLKQFETWCRKKKSREYAKKKNAEYTYPFVSWVREYKESRPCKDCGGKFHFSSMDFDHRPGEKKGKSVSYLAHTCRKSLEPIKKEIAKCDLVCANCHRVRTWKRKYERGIKYGPGD